MAVEGDKRKVQTLYRKNLKLSQEMFTIISCFEIALRNKLIDIMLIFMEKSGYLMLLIWEVYLIPLKLKKLKKLLGN